MGGETMIKIYPEFDEDDLLVRLFHKGVKAQWTVEDVDWSSPVQFSTRQSLALARLLTPVYLGEQSAMIGASVALPQIAMAGETTAQLYLASFLMDEARHFEALTTLYRRLEYRPLSIREMPEMLQYHNRLRQGDRVDWVWGILISDIFAKNFYQMFAKTQPHAQTYLRLMGCNQPGGAHRLAQIVAAAALCLEISAAASMASHGSENFMRTHLERGGLRSE